MSAEQGSTNRAVIWVLAARQAERALGVISIAILARLLSPGDFGLVALAGSVVAVVEVISAFGFDWALVRMPSASREHYDTAWTLRLLTSLVIAAILCLGAYPSAQFLQHPEITWLIIAMGANIVIGGAENIWMAEFRRESRFEPEFKLRIGSKIAGFVISVALAVFTRSYWALVIGVTASRLAGTVISFMLHAGRPRWDLSRRADLLRFSIWLLLGNLTEALSSRFAAIWLGRTIGARGVGFYSMAGELASLATSELAAPINRAVFAKYSQYGNNIPLLREGYERVSGLIWLVGFPAAVGIGVCASQIVAILLGGQWDESVQVLQVLAIAGLLGVIVSNTHYVYWALGRSRFVTVLAIVGTVVFVVLTVVFSRMNGFLGVAWAQVVASLIVAAVNLSALFRTLDLRLADFISRNYRVVVASSIMGAAVFGLGNWLEHDLGVATIVTLFIMVAVGATLYGAALFALWSLTGKPPGAEREAFALASQAGARIATLLRSATGRRARSIP